MASLKIDRDRRDALVLRATAVLAGIATLLSILSGELLTALLAALVTVSIWLVIRRSGRIMLTDGELDRLRQAELALGAVTDPHDAARELAEHAIQLLGARSAVVLVEGIGDTVRVSAGPTAVEDVYGSGSKMRLLDDAGVPCGSIAVSARADGRPYTPRHERILDALAERVSTTLHQLSLLTEVRAERKKLADLFGSSSDGIFSVGSDLRVRSWNPAMERITGVSAVVAMEQHVTQSFRPADVDGRPRHGSADPGRSGAMVESILLSIDVGDEQRWLTCSYAPLSDGGYVVIARDDTERKKLQDDKDGWIAQVSHELRTPLTPIKGFIHTLIRRDAQLGTDDRQKIYEIMLREEQRLESLVNSLLRSTQLDQDGLVADVAPVDWVAIVTEQVGNFRRQDPSRTIELRVSDDARTVTTDADVATGILTNLLSNALKYADPGTSIEVTVETATNAPGGDDLVTSVVDHGPGIPRSDQDRIFDKFTRLGDHLTRPQQGVGLGLYIARRSAEKLDGRLWVDQTDGGGSSFRFTLPMVAARVEPPVEAPVAR
ncbi:ATP-binding protein [Actinospongicola halichondriae]|uniref:PAS domain-containing sensor histidine kinase n=1 Tax=Actinospongicola halichondriae TaxID=3236844 RepID=UPI003D46A3B4